jgi:hypothetical protein
MSNKVYSPLVLAAVLSLLSLPAAAQYSDAVKGACKADYKRFCKVFAVGDPGLKKCMDQAGRSLSKTCVQTLVDSGVVTKSRATQRWKHTLD